MHLVTYNMYSHAKHFFPLIELCIYIFYHVHYSEIGETFYLFVVPIIYVDMT